jgi:hypothetical protein
MLADCSNKNSSLGSLVTNTCPFEVSAIHFTRAFTDFKFQGKDLKSNQLITGFINISYYLPPSDGAATCYKWNNMTSIDSTVI